MTEKMVVGSDLTPNWLRKYANIWAEINSQLIRGLETAGTGLTLEHLQALVEHRNPFKIPLELVADWQKFYHDLFGLEVDFSGLTIPGKKRGFDRLIVVAQGMTPQRLYDKCQELFPCWKWTDQSLDEIVQSERTSKDGPYAVWFRDTVEADEDLRNLSANALKKQGIPGITLEERLLMELKYFKETGKHLDIVNWTLCAGSRDSDGDVPRVRWHPDGREFCVSGDHPGDSTARLRSRRAVR